MHVENKVANGKITPACNFPFSTEYFQQPGLLQNENNRSWIEIYLPSS